MKKKKIIIVGIIVLVLSLGISYALINYNIFGRNNGQLVLGNIWMRYRENNQLNIDGNKDIKVNNITFYTVNQVMATQELNELARCIDYFNSNLYVAAEEEIDIQEFCQGTGTRNGMTLQQMWDSSYQEEGFMEEVGNEFINNNIMILENDVYIVNPIMATQELNELGKCIVLNSNEEFDEGSDSKSYCKGTGRASNGYTFQENLDNGDWFPTEVLTSFEENNVILAKKISYTSFKINPIMQEEESGTGILGKCESLFNNETFDEGSNAESFCKGTGTMEGGVTFQKLLDEEYNNENFLAEIGYQMLNDKIILPVLDANYFEFTIEGRNTYTKKGIWYEIVLMHGDEHETRSERIKDEFLTFTLTEVIDGEEVQLFNNRSYKDLKNQRIWVETIPASTVKDIEKTYRLYMNFVPYIKVGEVIPNSGKEVDYSFDTWNNEVYGSIKVKVTGDFLEKEVEYKIPEGCFQTADIDDGNVIIVGYDNTCTNALVIPNIINDKNVKEIAPYAFSDLEIVSLKFEKNSSLEAIYENSFTYNNIKSVTIPDSVTYLDCSAFDTNVTINKRADLSCSLTPTDESCFDFEFVDIKTNSNMTDEELAACVSIFDSLELPYDEGSTSENFCKGTGTIDGGITFQQFMYEGVSQPENFMNIIGNQLLENNIITIDVAITNYDASCESDVVIPSEVAGLPVTIIANNCSNNGGKSISNNKFDNIQSNNLVYNNFKSNVYQTASLGSCGAFGAKNLTSVVIPNTIKVIEENAFEYNDLGNVTFQDSSKLETIKSSSFTGNNIQSVTIPDSVTYLDCLAFDSNVNINKKSDLSCSLTPTDASCFYTTLIDNNGKEEVVIMGYDNSCGTNVVIPSEIDGNPVTVIGNSCTGIGAYPAANKSFNNAYLNDLIYKNSRFNVDTIEISNCGAFLFKDLINVVIPDTVRLIEDEAFMYNQLTNITIPNSVVEIGQNAFGYNGLTSVRFEENSKLETISLNAFTDNQLTSVTIPDSVTYLSCQAFDSDVTVNKKETLTCVSDGK